MPTFWPGRIRLFPACTRYRFECGTLAGHTPMDFLRPAKQFRRWRKVAGRSPGHTDTLADRHIKHDDWLLPDRLAIMIVLSGAACRVLAVHVFGSHDVA